MTSILKNIALKESIHISEDVFSGIVRHTRYNLTLAIHYLMLFVIREGKNGKIVFNPEIYDDVYKTLTDIVNCLIIGNDLSVMDKIRGHIYKLMVHNIPYNIIIHKMVEILLPKISKINPCTQYNICYTAQLHDDRIRLASKPVYHIESFCLKVFRELKILAIQKKK